MAQRSSTRRATRSVVLGEPKQITSSSAHEVLPTTSERWIVWTVWLGPTVGHSGIFAYDRTTNAPHPVAGTVRGDRSLRLSGDQVAFTRNDAVHVLDLTTGNTILVPPSGGSQDRGDVSGDLIVWDDYLLSRPGYKLFLYDVSTEALRPIVEGTHAQLRPRVFGGRVVWEDGRYTTGSAYDIFMLDIPTWTETPITVGPGRQWNAHISGDVVAWQSGGATSVDIHAYDVGTGVPYPVSTHPASQWLGAGEPISGTRIVYTDDRNGNDDVFMYDLATETETQITNHPADQNQASIFGNYIVYSDNQNGNWDIYQVEISSASFEVLDALIDGFVATGAISDTGIAEALRALSDQAASALERGSTQAAIRTLGAFLRLVDGQTGVHVSPEAAGQLTETVGAILETA